MAPLKKTIATNKNKAVKVPGRKKSDVLPTIQEKYRKETLRSRAVKLAAEDSGADIIKEHITVLKFGLGNENYAIENSYLKEVAPLKDITFLPCTPAFITGIINLRGRIISILDIKKILGLPESGITDIHKIIIVEDRGLCVGLVADKIEGFIEINMDEVQKKLPESASKNSNLISGITINNLIIINIRSILNDSKIIVNDQL